MITEMDIIPVLAEHVLLWPTARLGCVSALRTQDAHRSPRVHPRGATYTSREHITVIRAHHSHPAKPNVKRRRRSASGARRRRGPRARQKRKSEASTLY